jgi:hypothetical protein
VVPGYVNIGASGVISGIAWNGSGLTGGVAGDNYSVWLTKENNANGTVYDSEDGSLDPLDQTTPNGQSHVFTLDVPTSVFTNPTDTSPADNMEAHVTTYGTWGNSSNLDVHKCDSLLIDDFEQHIYGCLDELGCEGSCVNYNYDPSVTHSGFDPTDTSSPCASCTHNPFAQFAANDGDVRIQSVSTGNDNNLTNGSGDGSIDVIFEGFASDPSGTIASYELHAEGTTLNALGDQLVQQSTQLSPIGIGSFAQNASTGTYEYTVTFNNLDYGNYRFNFTSTRTHTLHDGTTINGGLGHQCSSYVDIEVFPG